MRLLLFNLASDRDDPNLGFAAQWIDALAKRFESVSVISMRVGRTSFARNVRVFSLGKELGHGEARRLIRFYRQLRRVLAEDRPDVCFSHMNPLFSVLAAPWLRMRGVPVVTWFAHPSLTWTLRLAHHLSDGMVSTLSTSYPYRADKLTVTGQGIDTELFAPNHREPEQPPVILCAGRLSPSKDHSTLIRAAGSLRKRYGQPFRVRFVGSPASARDEGYASLLLSEVQRLGLQDVVRFEPGLRISELPSHYRRCTVHVNLTAQGFGDKVALEAMSTGRPSVIANESFAPMLGRYEGMLLFRPGDSDDLCRKLEGLLDLPSPERTKMGLHLRDRVRELHSLERLTAKIHDLLLSLKKLPKARNGAVEQGQQA